MSRDLGTCCVSHSMLWLTNLTLDQGEVLTRLFARLQRSPAEMDTTNGKTPACWVSDFLVPANDDAAVAQLLLNKRCLADQLHRTFT